MGGTTGGGIVGTLVLFFAWALMMEILPLVRPPLGQDGGRQSFHIPSAAVLCLLTLLGARWTLSAWRSLSRKGQLVPRQATGAEILGSPRVPSVVTSIARWQPFVLPVLGAAAGLCAASAVIIYWMEGVAALRRVLVDGAVPPRAIAHVFIFFGGFNGGGAGLCIGVLLARDLLGLTAEELQEMVR